MRDERSFLPPHYTIGLPYTQPPSLVLTHPHSPHLPSHFPFPTPYSSFRIHSSPHAAILAIGLDASIAYAHSLAAAGRGGEGALLLEAATTVSKFGMIDALKEMHLLLDVDKMLDAAERPLTSLATPGDSWNQEIGMSPGDYGGKEGVKEGARSYPLLQAQKRGKEGVEGGEGRGAVQPNDFGNGVSWEKAEREMASRGENPITEPITDPFVKTMRFRVMGRLVVLMVSTPTLWIPLVEKVARLCGVEAAKGERAEFWALSTLYNARMYATTCVMMLFEDNIMTCASPFQTIGQPGPFESHVGMGMHLPPSDPAFTREGWVWVARNGVSALPRNMWDSAGTCWTHQWYTLYTPFRAVYAPMYTRYACIYIIYTPYIHLTHL